MSSYISEASLSWLESILAERFGQPFRLRLENDSEWHLFLEGQSRFIAISADPYTFKRADSDLPFTQWDAEECGWHSAMLQPIPAPGIASLRTPLIETMAWGYSIGYDLLGLCHWMLSRQEEVGRTDLDSHGRFPATSSHAFRNGYLERPVVDEWLHILRQVIQRTWPGIVLRPLSPSMRVSHDVDGPSRYVFSSVPGLLRTIAGDLLRRGDPGGVIRGPWLWLTSRQKLHPKDPSNSFDWIMDRSDENGLKSAFYFICGRTDPKKDAVYSPEDRRIRALMRHIHERGHEVGLHPSYATYQDPGALTAEAARLRRICAEEGIEQVEWGGRMHYLRWETPTTLLGWEKAGMNYESTLSYADRPGFRCGTCHEFPAFDPVAGRQLKVRIRPLVAMECTIMAPRYLGLGEGGAALSKFIELKRNCEAVGGCFTTLWHNTSLEHDRARNLYKSLLVA